MGGILDLLQGAVSAGNQAKGAYVNRATADTGSLIQLLRQQRQDALAEKRQAALDEQNAMMRPLAARHLQAETANLEDEVRRRGQHQPRYQVVQDEKGFYRVNMDDPTDVTPLSANGTPLRPKKPAGPSATAGKQVLLTPDGVVIVDKGTGTSVPVSKPGATVPPQGGSGQLQPRAAGNQKLQALAIENRNQMNVIDEAIRRVRSNPKAMGAKNLLPDILMQRMDPEGVATRAAVADIGSLKIHERSGAAVTASESPRLMPFVPSVKDTPEAVIAKLSRLRAYLDQETQALEAAGAVVPKDECPEGVFAR
jgi:hypothetical protein